MSYFYIRVTAISSAKAVYNIIPGKRDSARYFSAGHSPPRLFYWSLPEIYFLLIMIKTWDYNKKSSIF